MCVTFTTATLTLWQLDLDLNQSINQIFVYWQEG